MSRKYGRVASYLASCCSRRAGHCAPLPCTLMGGAAVFGTSCTTPQRWPAGACWRRQRLLLQQGWEPDEMK